jgi:hypothetical protein
MHDNSKIKLKIKEEKNLSSSDITWFRLLDPVIPEALDFSTVRASKFTFVLK